MKLTGTVIKKPFGRGSKSDSDAYYLETSRGTFRLRASSGKSFGDPFLQSLVGKEVSLEGMIDGKRFLLPSSLGKNAKGLRGK